MSQLALKQWTVEDVCLWLEGCRGKLGAKTDVYVQLIQEGDVDGEVLVDITDQGLTQLGVVSFGHRHYLLKSIQQLLGTHKGHAMGAGSHMSGAPMPAPDMIPNSDVSRMVAPEESLDPRFPPSRDDGVHVHSKAMLPPMIPVNRMGFAGSRPGGIPMPAPMAMQGHHGGPGPSGYMPNFNFHDNQKGANSMTRAAMPRLHTSTPRIHESKVVIGRKIGSGSVGNVYAGTFEEHPVAIKQHKPDGGPLDAKALQEFEIEVGKMTAVNHPCIVRCYGMLEPTPGIVLELVNGGSLFHILHAKRDESFTNYQLRLPWPVRMRYMLDSIYGLRAVHAAGMIHGDFKTLNMLVGPDHRVKVADFGLSKCIGTLTVLPGTKTITGTPQYMAPEIMQSLPQSMRVDMYSVGIVMWELLTGLIPWAGMDIVQIIQQVTMKVNDTQFPPPGRPKLSNQHVLMAPVGFINLMQEAWAQNPNDRPTTDTCVQVLESIHQSHGMYPFREKQNGPLQYQMPAHTPPAPVPAAPFVPPAGPMVHRGKTPRVSTSQIPASSTAVPKGTLTNIPSHFDAMLEAPMGAPAASGKQWNPPETGGLNPPPIFLAVGGMDMLIDMMHEAKDEATQAQGAGAVFEACANNPGNQTTLANSPGQGVAVMVGLLKNSTHELQGKAAQAIAAACGSNVENRAAAVMAGGIEALIKLLGSSSTTTQENAANALANVIKLRLVDGRNAPFDNARASELEGLRQLKLHGGMQALMQVIRHGTPRVKEAATAAVANAMEDSAENRTLFLEAGGIQMALNLLKVGDPHAQENATTALWNLMVDNEDACAQVVQMGGIPILVQQVLSGTEVGQELAAGAIWKACACDPSVKDEVRVAIPGLVQLLATGTQGAQEHAAGAIRSACINSAKNKEVLNKCGGIEALLNMIRDGVPGAAEQAGAALANALANCEMNQKTASENKALEVLLSVVERTHDVQSEIVSCCVSALRNLCADNQDQQEELGRRNGIQTLVSIIPDDEEMLRSRSMQLTGYVLGALWKACTRCSKNRATLRSTKFTERLEALNGNGQVSAEVLSGAAGILQMLASRSPSPSDADGSAKAPGAVP
mmetsp:Transcript_25344/g.63936  ORF Transcript_25344/g.63936 Transcript_25344/m.63936 type:complete len:1095 (+) Transcript_25344:103-3387(+)